MIFQAGQRVGPYVILGRLGVGGMGVVFSAWDNRLQRDVAIKMLRHDVSTPEMRVRFLREARAASALNHPHICTVFDIGSLNGDPYLVMELLRGQTLRQRMRSQPLTGEELVQLGLEVADALEMAHAQGVIHRDIKPANIFLTQRAGGGFAAKVLDFGLAKVEAEIELQEAARSDGSPGLRRDLSEVRATIGTVGYMSPEQARGEELDGRSDLFSLGVVMYEVATGEPPFRGATNALTFVQLLSHAPEPIRTQNPDVPPALEKVILHLLEKDRNLRYAGAAELSRALENVTKERSPLTPKSLWQGAARVLRRPGSLSGSGMELPAPSAEEKADAEDAGGSPTPMAQHLRPARRVASRPAGAAFGIAPPSPGDLPAAPASATETPTSLPPLPLRQDAENDRSDEQKPPSLWPVVIGLSAFLLLLIASLVVYYERAHSAAAIPPGPAVVVMEDFANHTGDGALTGTLSTALQLALEQSPRLSIRSREDLWSSLHTTVPSGDSGAPLDLLEHAAAAAGGSLLLRPEAQRDGESYTLLVRIYDANGGSERMHAQESAGSRELLPDAIDRLAIDIRSGLGEDARTASGSSLPLQREASGNLDALHAYDDGLEAASAGQMIDAMHDFQLATSLDTHFTQAYLRLADLFHRQRADLSAADAATKGEARSHGAGERTRLLAQAYAELYAAGNPPRAVGLLRQILETWSADPQARVLLSLSLRMEGKWAEAEQVAEQVLSSNPNDYDAALQAELDLVALDRPGDAARIEETIRRTGRSHPGVKVLIGYLGSRENGERSVNLPDTQDRVAAQEYSAALLDADGLFSAGLTAWQGISERAAGTPELASAGSRALSMAVLDRALIGDCSSALEVARTARALPAAADSIFRIGLGSALCDDFEDASEALEAMTRSTGQKYAMDSYFRANLTAALELRQGNAAGALQTLEPVRDFDAVSLTAYLRGLAHLGADQGQAAIADFTGILQHPGSSTLVNSVSLPMAQFQLARAYAATADPTRSVAAYGRFLDLWHGADGDLAIIQEARKAVGQPVIDKP